MKIKTVIFLFAAAVAVAGLFSTPATAQAISASCDEAMPTISLSSNTGIVSFQQAQMNTSFQQKVDELADFHVSIVQLSCIEKTNASIFHLSLTPKIELENSNLIEFDYSGTKIRLPAIPQAKLRIERIRVVFIDDRPLVWQSYRQTNDGNFQGETEPYYFPIDWGIPSIKDIDISEDPNWFKQFSMLDLQMAQ